MGLAFPRFIWTRTHSRPARHGWTGLESEVLLVREREASQRQSLLLEQESEWTGFESG